MVHRYVSHSEVVISLNVHTVI